MSSTILVVDDEARFREILGLALQRAGHRVLAAGDGRAALALLETETVDVVMSDLRMPQMDGRSLLTAVKQRWPNVPVVVVTAHASLKDAVRTIKEGAFDYVSKPFEIDELERVIHNALALHRALDENARLQGELGARYGLERLIGISPAHRRIVEAVREVAQNRANVLLTGESGTGKEVVARAIHYSGPRRERAFVAVNCAAIPESLLESELFGHVKGAFTGAASARDGHFTRADGGTLFLDEIGDMPLAMQAKILRVLEDRVVTPVGGQRETAVDVRIIAASNRDLAAMMRAGQFREDLYYRLNVVQIALPPLRERREDIALLAAHFARLLGPDMGRSGARFSEAALARLHAYAWPGNVRELRNCVERALISARGPQIDVGDLPPYIEPSAAVPSGAPPRAAAATPELPEGGFALEATLEDIERRYILAALERSGGVQVRAAELLGIKERSLWHRIKKLGIRITRGASDAAPE